MNRLLASFSELGSVPTGVDDFGVPMASVDWVTSAICKLGLAPKSTNKVFHLVGPDVSMKDIIRVAQTLCAGGVGLKLVEYEKWCKQIPESPSCSLWVFSGLFENASFPFSSEVEAVDDANTVQTLSLLGEIPKCPAVNDTTLQRYFRFLLEQKPQNVK